MIPDVSTSRGALGERLDDCQNAGPGKYASSATDGLNTMCGTRPSAHCARNSDRSSCWARVSSYHERPIAMNAESQLHWWGYSVREGSVDAPSQLSSSTCRAPRRERLEDVVSHGRMLRTGQRESITRIARRDRA